MTLRGLKQAIGLFAASRLGLASMLLLAGPAIGRTADIQAFHKAFGPKALLRVSCPTVAWEIWPGADARVTSAVMRLNGQEVSARYDASRRVLEYRPPVPLAPGAYKVECRVVVDRQLVVTKDWSFQIAAEAQPALAAADDAQSAALSAANDLRRALGLDPMVMDPRLNAAAIAHSRYLAANNRAGHYEKAGESDFAGQTPSDRMESFGYMGGSWECVSAGIPTAEQSIRDLFDAPYHRLPFMQPGSPLFGSGFTGKRMTMNFGVTEAEATVVSPADGQGEIPLAWTKIETPNPLRLHAVTGSVGYPIMLAQFGVEKIEVKQAELFLGNDAVPVLVNTPANDDHLQNAVIVIPERPLQPSSAYTVKVVYTAEGKEQCKTWRFRTAAGPTPPRDIERSPAKA